MYTVKACAPVEPARRRFLTQVDAVRSRVSWGRDEPARIGRSGRCRAAIIMDPDALPALALAPGRRRRRA